MTLTQHVSRSEGPAPKAVRYLLVLLLAVCGLILLLGGASLIVLGGNWVYAIFGLGFLTAAFGVGRRSAWSVILLVVLAALAVFWALFEADGNRWALIPRLTLPIGFAVVALFLSPWIGRLKIMPAVLAGGGLGVATLLLPLTLPDNTMQNEALIAAIPQPTEARLRATSDLDRDWIAYGGTRGSQRFSGLSQITPDNIENLIRAWVFNTGDLPSDLENSKYGAETTPLKVGDTLYLCTALNVVIALDAGTGQQKWRFDPKVDKSFIPYTAACRGVSYHRKDDRAPARQPVVPTAEINRNTAEGTIDIAATNPINAEPTDCQARIIAPTLDGRILALDAQTGLPCSEFIGQGGVAGEIQMTVGMGQVLPGMVASTSPHTIVNNVIVTNHQVKDNIDIDAPSGVIQGFSAITGEHLWAWDMNRPELSMRPEPPEEFSRGTPNSWTIASADPALGLIYVPMGNSAGDYISYDRSDAEITYSTALVALDVTTGKPRWHFQTVHNDVWDYDLGSQATLVDFPTAGGPRPALILPTKQGDIYVLDRATGQALVDVEERPVPQGGIEPMLRAPTQPFSTYHTLAQAPLGARDMWGMSLIDQLYCRIQFARARYDGVYTPGMAKQPWIEYPGYNGGSDWGGVAVDPARGLIIANYNDMPNYNQLLSKDHAVSGGGGGEAGPMEGAVYAIKVNAGMRNKMTGLICKEPPYGGIRAIDLASGETVWDRPLGTARANGPWGIPSRLPFNIGTPNNGGAVLTGSGLAFIGAATDNLVRAIDVRSGETLWTDVLPGGGQATPMTYEHEGRQYVLIMAGGHHFMMTPISDALVAYALPDESE
ncbi:MAG: membrane-bound PQQ-dependent dehydrogenase, glucose/quinate/shikimate family [Litorimonas sp.]